MTKGIVTTVGRQTCPREGDDDVNDDDGRSADIQACVRETVGCGGDRGHIPKSDNRHHKSRLWRAESHSPTA